MINDIKVEQDLLIINTMPTMRFREKCEEEYRVVDDPKNEKVQLTVDVSFE